MYNAYVTRIKNLRKHSNADRLQIGECFGNSVIVGLTTESNELGIYFPTDGKLGVEYATVNNLLQLKSETGEDIGGFLDAKKRNIKTIRLRGEPSDGLFMPLTSLETFTDISTLKEGDIITELNGIVICEKYIPAIQKHSGQTESNKICKNKDTKIKYPFFKEHIDTNQLAYNLHAFKPGDIIEISLKYHGTSGRTSYAIREEKTQNWFRKLFRLKPKSKKSWQVITGTRRQVLQSTMANEIPAYATENYRIKWHNFFKNKLHKGETVYYEIVGYSHNDSLIMASGNNKKTNDKEFIKQYGEHTNFTYGMYPDQNNAIVYRMTMTNEDGVEVEYPTELVKRRCEEMAIEYVLLFDKFIFTTAEDLMERVNTYLEGPDPVGITHTREGVVVKNRSKTKFSAFKHKSFYFKCIEGVIKTESLEPDVEEMQEMQEIQESENE